MITININKYISFNYWKAVLVSTRSNSKFSKKYKYSNTLNLILNFIQYCNNFARFFSSRRCLNETKDSSSNNNYYFHLLRSIKLENCKYF